MYFCFEAEKSAREEVLALEVCAQCSVNRNTKEEQPPELALLPAAGDTGVSPSQDSVSSCRLLLGGGPNPIISQSSCHNCGVTIEMERQAVMIDNLTENLSASGI